MTLAGGGLNACVRVHLQAVTGISHPACRVTVLGGKGNYPDGVPARLGQRKVVSLSLLQSHEPACSRIGAPLILHDTIHPHPFELPTLGGKCCTALFDYSHALSSNLMVFSWLRGAAAKTKQAEHTIDRAMTALWLSCA